MGAWSSLAKSLTNLFSKSGTKSTATITKTWTSNGVKTVQTVTKVAGDAAQAGAKTLLTWGNAFKVAVVGGFTFLFLNGGASNVVAGTLGISQDAAQILIIFLFLVLMILILRYIINYMRAHMGLKREYLETPIIQNTRNHRYNEEERRWERRRSSGSLFLQEL